MNFLLSLSLFVASFVVAQTQTSPGCESRLEPPDDDDSTNLGYDVIVQQSTFTPGDIVAVTINAPAAPAHFRGITLYAVKGDEDDGELVGDWFPPVRGLQRYYSAISCRNSSRAMIVERKFRKKSAQNFPIKFHWASPMECANGSNVYFRATIAERRDLVQRDISATIQCIDTTLMEMCPFPTQGLATTNYNTSFEHGKPPVWVETGRGHGGSWTLGQLATPSKYTGPARAHHGNSYMYLEASFPATYRSVATLTTVGRVRGCFCLAFALSMNVQALRGHTFQVRANQVVVYRTTEADVSWARKQIQFTQHVPTKISLEAIRGVNWVGDVAIDDVSIYSGLCRN